MDIPNQFPEKNTYFCWYYLLFFLPANDYLIMLNKLEGNEKFKITWKKEEMKIPNLKKKIPK